MTAITTAGLTKYYGDTPGIIDLDLDVPEGAVFGFLGPNGAGKSTTIRTLLDFLRPSRGTATILGMDSRADSVAIRRRVGYLPGDLAMYDTMTGREMCTYLANLRRVDATARMEEIAARMKLDLDRKIGAYSTGNRQKVGIVLAFQHDPELLILDEPSAGLDPLMQQELYTLINEAAAAGRTVFLSSHVLPEVEHVAGIVGIVRNARLVALETIDALKAKTRRRIEFVFADPITPGTFLTLPGVEAVNTSDDRRRLEITVTSDVDDVIKQAGTRRVVNVSTHDGDLEDAFLAYYRDDDAA